jgi:hypothetical protein
MKTILTGLLIFISITAYSQLRISIDSTSNIITEEEAVKEWLDDSYSIIGLMTLYKVNCYNDSTLKHTHMPKWNDKCFTQMGDLATGYYYELDCNIKDHYTYIHKEPTFEGFINWINDKLILE